MLCCVRQLCTVIRTRVRSSYSCIHLFNVRFFYVLSLGLCILYCLFYFYCFFVSSFVVSVLGKSLAWKSISKMTCFVSVNWSHTHTFNGLFSRTTCVSRHQKGKPIWILLKQEMMGGSGIIWTMCKSFAPHSRQITMPVRRHSIFFGPDALLDAQPTLSVDRSVLCY